MTDITSIYVTLKPMFEWFKNQPIYSIKWLAGLYVGIILSLSISMYVMQIFYNGIWISFLTVFANSWFDRNAYVSLLNFILT